MTARTCIHDGVVQTLCRQCDMRCGINAHIRDGRIEKISGVDRHPENRGRLCAKAVSAIDLAYHPDRLREPLKRMPDGRFEPVSYAQAMDEIAAKMTHLRDTHAARALGAWTGEALGFLQQEEYARRFIHAFGSPNYFSADSVCYAARYIAYCLLQGYWNPCPDFANAGLIVLWGANVGITHPPYMRLIDEGRRKGARLVVVDPRASEAARKADLFVQLRPGTDGALTWGLIRGLIAGGNYDHDFVEQHTKGFQRLAEYARRFTPDYVVRQTGVAAEQLAQLSDLLVINQPRVINYIGIALEHQVNGLHNMRAVGALTGLCGAVDVPGGEPWPLPSRRRSLSLYDQLPLDHLNPIGADRYPAMYKFVHQCHSMTAMDYMLGRGEYPLRGLILSGANPVLTNPNSKKVSAALDSLDLFVVRDLFLTATARRAHYVLPAATFLEREELHYHAHLQRVSLSNAVLKMPGVTTEYTFWRDLAQRLDLADQFPWIDEAAVNRWILEPTGIRRKDLKAHPEGLQYAEMSYRKYRQRPFATPSGKFEFVSSYLGELGQAELPEYLPPDYVERPDPQYPFILITGARKSVYYHSRIIDFRKHRKAPGKPECDLHPDDAAELGIGDGDLMRVVSAKGAIELAARVAPADEILPGCLQITHGWDAANVNLLTDDRQNDPISGFPNMKIVTVRLEKV